MCACVNSCMSSCICNLCFMKWAKNNSCIFCMFLVKRNLLGGQKRSFWSVLEGFETSSPSHDFTETMNSTRSVAGVK